MDAAEHRATMVTAILPSLTNEPHAPDEALDDEDDDATVRGAQVSSRALDRGHNSRDSVALSLDSDLTITPDRFSRRQADGSPVTSAESPRATRPAELAGLVGLFTGCGALLALSLFLPLPAKFGAIDGVTLGQAVAYSYYVVAAVAACVAVLVFAGLRGLKGEDGKGWNMLFRSSRASSESGASNGNYPRLAEPVLPYAQLLWDSILLGFSDSSVGLGYLGGFVARASTVAISLFIPLSINTYFMSHGFCKGSPNDPSPELKKECREAYILSSVLTGLAQLMGLICAPAYGYLAKRSGVGGRWNYAVQLAAVCGIFGYVAFARLPSPELKDVDGRGGSPAVIVIAGLIGTSQIGAIVCSLGSLGRGVLDDDNQVEDASRDASTEAANGNGVDGAGAVQSSIADERSTLLSRVGERKRVSRMRLKGSVAGVYSLCGGAAILLLTKLGGHLFDVVSRGAPFYMMAVFNVVLLIASLLVDISQRVRRKRKRRT